MHDALVDTGSAFSIMSESLYSQLPTRPPIQSFKKPASDIVGVGSASAEVKGYIDVPLQIAGVEVAHPLLLVSGLVFLIGMDVLRPHSAATRTRTFLVHYSCLDPNLLKYFSRESRVVNS